MRGKAAAHWGGGRHVSKQGYVKVIDPTVRNVHGNYVLEHRRVMESMLGRKLTPGETVHHINGDKSDNRPENLQVRTHKHGKGVVMVCGDCGSRNIVSSPLN